MTYQWKWVRGQGLTVKMNWFSVAPTDTFVPCGLSSNLMVEPLANGAAIFGVLKNKCAVSALATDDDAPVVIISPDIFEVRTVGNLGIGAVVQCINGNQVGLYGSAQLSCGYVVDYDPPAESGSTLGLAHIVATFQSANTTGVLNGA